MLDNLTYILILLSSSIGAGIGSFMTAYLNKKGDNLATKEDIGEITHKIEFIKNRFGKKYLLSSAYINKKIEAYNAIDQLIYKLRKIYFHDITRLPENFILPEMAEKIDEVSSAIIDATETYVMYLDNHIAFGLASLVNKITYFLEAQFLSNDALDASYSEIVELANIIRKEMKKDLMDED